MAEPTSKPRMTRRDFLAALTAGTFGVMGAASLSGCGKPKIEGEGGTGAKTDVSGDEAGTSANWSDQVEIYDTDLLVIGFGNGGIAATWTALGAGRQVTIVDKAPYHHGGPSGWAWGCYGGAFNPMDLTAAPTGVNQQIWMNALGYYMMTHNPAMDNNATYMINHGQTLVQRDETGQIVMQPYTYTFFEQYFHRETDELQKRSAVQYFDNTMLTNFFVNNGVCYGAMGIHLPTGKFRVFRSKATIMGSGSPVWMYGWKNTKPVSYGSSDNTGDLQAAAYRLGCGIGEAEDCSFDYANPEPRVAFGVSVWFDAVMDSPIFGKDGTNLAPYGYSLLSGTGIDLHRLCAQTVLDGNGGPNGGVFTQLAPITAADDFHHRDVAATHKKFFNRTIDDGHPIECVAEMFDKGGEPVVDSSMMTEIVGLFDLRGGGTAICSAANQMYNSTAYKVFGTYAGYCASQYAAMAGEPKDLDWTCVADEFARLQDVRTRTVESPLRPHEIREKLQQAVYTFGGIIRRDADITAAIAEIERIRQEDLPRMALRDTARNANREWKDALETINLLDCAEMFARASDLRKETNAKHKFLRVEHPDQDPSWDMAMTVCRLSDGAMVCTKEALPALA